ncbi:Hypothetical protein LEPBI_II0267 [Leptospira biflexa serovar Patoc strain 'Patoc 1 (Paris)']|uniref:Uncharacterized protein n=2 Tax=Leptospira biflexa TaxID=172 RepID=B0SUB6_LEPBP|nr:Hypothetical protein LEPBI_II0267 [Leptospira biflexa serovar Patoc strain 'Patoc 1 (Paris)']
MSYASQMTVRVKFQALSTKVKGKEIGDESIEWHRKTLEPNARDFHCHREGGYEKEIDT